MKNPKERLRKQSHLPLQKIKNKKRMKHLGIDLPKEAKDLYSQNYKIPMKEIKYDTKRWRIKHVLGLEELIL